MNRNPAQVVYIQPPSNGFGTAGFTFAIIGLFTLGIFWPLSLLLCFCGLFFKPAGLATAGFIISLVGIMVQIFVVLVMMHS